ncbi:MOSC domain-containing protein [Paenibacillus sp. TAB 01]|uniref:MOSC domain-containing protein n=1 Tax=Paenibacillus sp. TAB 01 TaxID=3368988 RepID=UPI0037526AB8
MGAGLAGMKLYWLKFKGSANEKYRRTRPKAPNFESPELMAVDAASVLIITDASLRKLERLWGKPLDLRRFRANLVVSLDETAWNETDWTDRCLSVGSAVLKIDTICERCSMITIDPDTIERDPSLLKIVNQELALQFGWYASVIQPGEVRTGDKLYFV